MFKLIKIENSHSSAPEILRLPKSDSYHIEVGMPLVMEDMRLRPAHEEEVMGYMSVTEAKSEDLYVCCFKIQPNMIFDADCGDDSNLIVGQLCAYRSADNGLYIYGVSSDEGQSCEVVDISDMKRNKTVAVRFLPSINTY